MSLIVGNETLVLLSMILFLGDGKRASVPGLYNQRHLTSIRLPPCSCLKSIISSSIEVALEQRNRSAKRHLHSHIVAGITLVSLY